MKILNLTWALLKHPITAILIAICLTVVGYKMSITAKEPVFSIKPPVLLAQNQTGSNRLKITWDDIPVENVYSVEVAIWNKGNNYIDFENVINSNPIKVMPTNEVDILNVKIIKVSRPELEISGKIIEESEIGESILINIENDEVLESLDGAIFHILYSSELEVGWTIKGRIKGVPEGFIKEDEYPAKPTSQTIFLSKSLFVIACVLLFTVIALQILRHRNGLIPRWGLFYSGLMISVFSVTWVFARVFPFFFYPEWLIM